MVVVFVGKVFLPVVDVEVWISSSVVLEANDNFAVITIYLVDIVLVLAFFYNAVNTPLREKNLDVNVRDQIVSTQAPAHFAVDSNQDSTFCLFTII